MGDPPQDLGLAQLLALSPRLVDVLEQITLAEAVVQRNEPTDARLQHE